MVSPRLTLFLLTVPMFASAGGERTNDSPPQVSLRKLCIDAPLVVLAKPLDPITPTQFRVQNILRGTGVTPGMTIHPVGLAPEQVCGFEDPDLAAGKPRPRVVAHALLFLEPVARGKGWRILEGGLRCCTEGGAYLAPRGPRGGRWTLEPISGVRWPVVVARVRNDLASIDQLTRYRRIGRSSRRAEAILGWVRERKGDFTALGPGTDESPVGWDSLQQEVFDWIFSAGDPEVAWQALELYLDLNEGDVQGLPAAFASPAGRELLLRMASDPKRLLGDRTRAVTLLGRSAGLESSSKNEKESLLARLAPLLSEKNEAFRVGLAETLARLGEPRVLPSLLQAYRESLPGPARDELALAVCTLAPASVWKDLTGNPPGIWAALRDLERQENTLTFWLTLRTPAQAVYECPTLVVERIGTLGFIAETKRFLLEPQNLDNAWSAGWKGGALVVRFDTGRLAAGNHYKVRVEGFVGKGKDRQKWLSEYRKFQIPARPDPNQPNRSIKR